MTRALPLLPLVALALCCTASVGLAARDARGTPTRLAVAPIGADATCDMDRYAINTASVSDGTGGTIVIYVASTGLRAQRLDPSGHLLWDSNGIQVSTAIGDKQSPIVVLDGAGGVIIAWTEYRDWVRIGVFVQRLDASGTPMWTTNGVAVRASGEQFMPSIAPDGAGGVIATWSDGPDVYAQRVGAAGTLLWNVGGVPVCTAIGDQVAPATVSDGAGGAIVAWSDMRSATTALYAQRLNASGTRQWAINGASIATLSGCPSDPAIISNGGGSAIVAWADLNGSNTVLRAQAISASGVMSWAANGVPVSSVLQNVVDIAAATDGAGGVVIGWSDQVPGFADCTLRAQRLDAGGTRLWGTSGVVVATSGTSLRESSLFAGDGAGGAYLVWKRPGVRYDLLAQHFGPSGAPQWGGAGLPVCEADGWRTSISTASTSAGGVVIAWADYRSEHDVDVYAQRFAPDGTALWPLDGSGVWVDPGVQVNPAGVPDGEGGMYLAWQQKVAGEYDIYLSRFNAAGLPVWPPVPVCAAAGSQRDPVVAPDGTGGVLVSWRDPRGSSGTFVQHFGADGASLWTVDGIEVPNPLGAFPYPCMIADGTGGAIFAGITFCCGAVATRMDSSGAVAWNEYLAVSPDSKLLWGLIPDGFGGAIACWSGFSGPSGDLYVQRIGHDGARAWGTGGVAIVLPALQWEPSMATDGAGGVIIAWYDDRSGDSDVYAQRIGGEGVARWAADGIPIAASFDYGSNPRIVDDLVGGAFIALTGGADGDLIVQRIDSTGSARWAQPRVVCGALHLQDVRSVAGDDAGGVLLAWTDLRDDPVRKIYAQRVDADGNDLWTSQGIVAGIHGDALTQPVIVPALMGGALVAWQDGLYSPRDTISLLRLPEPMPVAVDNGQPVDVGLAITSVIPNPASGPFLVRFVLPRAGAARLELFGVDGRAVARKTLDLAAGPHDVRMGLAPGTSSGMYWLRLSMAGAGVTGRVCLLH